MKGAQPWLGPATWKRNPVYLWGQFPPLDCRIEKWKERLSGRQRQERARIPRALSEALARSCESALFFEDALPKLRAIRFDYTLPPAATRYGA